MAATATCASPPPPALPAADAPAPMAQRPPLARRPRGTSTASQAGGVRRRVVSGAADDSDNSTGGAAGSNALSRANTLNAFLSCVAEEIRELVAAFNALPASEQRFPHFKTLWLAQRMSTLFHVEFWDSTPTDTHHAVLQVALELLVEAVGIPTREDDAVVHVASVVGHVFALYCAFSVQVSEPKIRITVDPSMWHSLTQLSELLTRRLAVSDSRAAREALTILRRLEHEDKAFLQCLGGSVGDYRLQTHGSTHYRPADSTATTAQAAELHVPDRREDEKQDMTLRLEVLSAQYNASLKALSQVDAKGENASSVAAPSMRGASRSGGRGLASTPSFLRTNRPVNRRVETGFGGGGGLMGGLWNDTRVPESDAWMSRLRQSLVSPPTEAGSGETDAVPNDGSCSVLGDDVASDLDAALLALEQELVREDDKEKPNRQAQGKDEDAARRARPTPPLQQRQPAQALSVVSSGHESDGLDELEAELLQDVTSAARSTQAIERLPAALRTASAVAATGKKPTSSRPRTPSSSERQSVPARDGERARQAISTMSSTYESDGLDELEAELARDVSTGAEYPATASRRVARPKEAQKPVWTVAKPAHRQRTQSVISIGAESDGMSELEAELRLGVSRTVSPHQASSSQHVPQSQLTTRSRAASLVSSGYESDDLDALNSKLEQSVRPQARPHDLRSMPHNVPPFHAKVVQSSVLASRGPIQAVTTAFPAPQRVSARLSSRSSDAGSVDELLALQRELDAASHPHPALQQKSPQAPARSRKRPAARSPSPETRPCKQPTPNVVVATTVCSPPAVRRSRRLSIASSARTESDAELAALEAELFAVPKVRPKSVVAQQVTRPTGSQATSMQQRPRGLSFASAMTESDEELRLLEAELSVNASTTIQKATPSPKPRAKPRAKTAPRPKGNHVAKAKDQQGKRATQPKPRRPRQPKAVNAAPQGATDTRVEVQVPVPAALPPAPATRISSRQSVASTYDSDGLDELDKELRAFH